MLNKALNDKSMIQDKLNIHTQHALLQFQSNLISFHRSTFIIH